MTELRTTKLRTTELRTTEFQTTELRTTELRTTELRTTRTARIGCQGRTISTGLQCRTIKTRLPSGLDSETGISVLYGKGRKWHDLARFFFRAQRFLFFSLFFLPALALFFCFALTIAKARKKCRRPPLFVIYPDHCLRYICQG